MLKAQKEKELYSFSYSLQIEDKIKERGT